MKKIILILALLIGTFGIASTVNAEEEEFETAESVAGAEVAGACSTQVFKKPAYDPEIGRGFCSSPGWYRVRIRCYSPTVEGTRYRYGPYWQLSGWSTARCGEKRDRVNQVLVFGCMNSPCPSPPF